jgi:hypothetical protein
MVDDVADVVLRQARIDRVADRLHARRGVVGLQVPMVVPRQSADAIVRLDA